MRPGREESLGRSCWSGRIMSHCRNWMVGCTTRLVTCRLAMHPLDKSRAYEPAMDQNVLDVMGFCSECPVPVDLGFFMNESGTYAVAATCTIVDINGGDYDPTYPGSEANLNLQYAEAMAHLHRQLDLHCSSPGLFTCSTRRASHRQ